MSAYDQFRNSVISKLDPNLPREMLDRVIEAMDLASTQYTFERNCTDMILYDREQLPEAAKAYIVSKKIEGTGEKTLEHYALVLKLFFLNVRKALGDIAANDIRAWLYSYQHERGISNRSLDGYRTVLNGFFEWAAAEEYIPKNPMAPIKRIRYETKQRQAMTQIDLEYVREACRTPFETAIVEVLYSTGCRVSELCELKLSDIDWDTGEVALFGKGKKHRVGYLNAKAIVSLRNYLEGRRAESEYIFCTQKLPFTKMGRAGMEKRVGKIVDRVSEKLSVPVTPHIFRHTTATVALGNGMPVQDVQRMLGHASIATTMIYAEVKDSDVKTQHAKHVI